MQNCQSRKPSLIRHIRSVNQVGVRTCWSGVNPRYFGIFKNLVKGIWKGDKLVTLFGEFGSYPRKTKFWPTRISRPKIQKVTV